MSDTEEAELVQFFLKMTRIGYAKSKKQVLALVEAILMKKWNVEEVRVSKGWWSSFQERHPQLTIRCAGTLAYTRVIVPTGSRTQM